MCHFNAASLEVCNLDQAMAMATLKGSMLKNNLFFSLEKTYPRGFVKMQAQAEKAFKLQDAYKVKEQKQRES